MASWACWGLWLGIGRTGSSDLFGGYLISHNAYYVKADWGWWWQLLARPVVGVL